MDKSKAEVLKLRRMVCDLLNAIYVAPRNADLQRAAHSARVGYIQTLSDEEVRMLKEAAVSRFKADGVVVTEIATGDLHEALMSAGTDLLDLVAKKEPITTA